MSRRILLLVVCVGLANCLPQFQKREAANVQNCAYGQCNQNNQGNNYGAYGGGYRPNNGLFGGGLFAAGGLANHGLFTGFGAGNTQNCVNGQCNQNNGGYGRKKREAFEEGSPEWQAYKTAELAHIAPSPGPLASVGRNFAQEQLNSVAPFPGPLAYVGRNFALGQLIWQQQQMIHQQNALNFIARGAAAPKEGSPEWQAYKNAELAFIAPSIGPLAPLGRNFAQEYLNLVAPAPTQQ